MSGEEVKYTKPEIISPMQNYSSDRVDPAKKRAYDDGDLKHQMDHSGIAGNRSLETVPLFKRTPSEVVYTNDRNAWIVLGVDRSKGVTTGYGGKGATQCAAIDLVAGRMASYARGLDDDGNPIKTNPDFRVDAARVYISQKSDIDEYFDLANGKVGNAPSRSAVGIKADEIRIIGRGGIKLVTGTDNRNSQGAPAGLEVKGIDLIGANDDADMQPLVKGDNLVGALKGLKSEIEQVREILYDFLKSQWDFNNIVKDHMHNSPFYGMYTAPDYGGCFTTGLKTIIHQIGQTEVGGIVPSMTSLGAWEATYLEPSEAYILSGYNHTN